MAHRELFLPDTVKQGHISLPPSYMDEIRADQASLAEDMVEIASVKHQHERELKDIDPNLELFKAKPMTTTVGVKAGYWHLVLKDPGHPASIMPLEYPDGRYREPGSWMYEWAHLQDLWNVRARKAHREAQQKAEAARQRQKDREREDRITELHERVASRMRTQILVTRKPA